MSAGRPEKPINEKLFWNLMSIPFATKESVAECLEVSKSTLLRWIQDRLNTDFETLKREKVEGLKLRLAGKQLETAMSGNVVMQIFLGKQYLGQADKIEQKVESIQETTFKIGWADEHDQLNPTEKDVTSIENPAIEEAVQASSMGETIGEDNKRNLDDVKETTRGSEERELLACASDESSSGSGIQPVCETIPEVIVEPAVDKKTE